MLSMFDREMLLADIKNIVWALEQSLKSVQRTDERQKLLRRTSAIFDGCINQQSWMFMQALRRIGNVN